MQRVRRTRYVVFSGQDEPYIDVAALLRGRAEATRKRVLYAISILRAAELPITDDELALALSLPSDRWVPCEGMDAGLLRRLAGMGVLVTDATDDETLAELARRDRELEDGQWNLYGALAHFLTRWRDIDLSGGIAEAVDADELPPTMVDAIEAFVARHGDAPPAFHSLPGARTELPLVDRDHGLYDVLARRRTTRRFDHDASLTVDELATVLYYVFGCHGYAGMAHNGLLIKRTSPSGGGLHPIEAYPLIAGVEAIAPGLYHYDARGHALELVAALGDDEARALADTFLCGQRYFSGAQLLVVMAARFQRSFWKYRRHQKAYASLMMDAAHLSQTLYLVAAELGLGAFVTAAINNENIEDRLGLDGFREGVLAISGCGRPAERRSPLEPEFVRYVPRETKLPRGA